MVLRAAEAGDSLWVLNLTIDGASVFFLCSGMVKTRIVVKLRQQCRSFGSQGTWKLNGQGTIIELRNFACSKASRRLHNFDFTCMAGGDSWLCMIFPIVYVDVGWTYCFDFFGVHFGWTFMTCSKVIYVSETPVEDGKKVIRRELKLMYHPNEIFDDGWSVVG